MKPPNDRKDLARIVTRILEITCQKQSSESIIDTKQRSPFDFEDDQRPTIGLRAYIERFVNGPWCSDEAMSITLLIIDRIVSKSQIVMTMNNVFLLFATSFMISSKVHDDKFYTNKWFAYVSGVSIREINSLELAALISIDFDVSVSQPDWLVYHSLLFVIDSSDHDLHLFF